MRRRKEWFGRMSAAYVVLWWVRAGHRPTVDEAIERLEHLRRHGPTQQAFTFRQAFVPPDEPQAGASLGFGNQCPAT
jgi:Domain of unknown function (DUF3291)